MASIIRMQVNCSGFLLTRAVSFFEYSELSFPASAGRLAECESGRLPAGSITRRPIVERERYFFRGKGEVSHDLL